LRAEFRPDYKLYPYLELEATRFLAGTEVTLTTAGWSGDLDSLVINPSSNPPMSREEILKLLNWPEKIEDGNLTFANMFQENINMVGDLFIGRFLDEFRSIMPIDFLTLEQDRQEGTFWMNMGKSLSEDLYLSYSRSLTSLSEQVWNLEWKILPNFSLLGDYSAAEGLRWQFQYNLRF
jgi:autotransporter translocation and assembly factor TamB